MAYTFRIIADTLDGATALPTTDLLTRVPNADGSFSLTLITGGAIAALGVIDPRQLWDIATEFPNRAQPAIPHDYVVASFAALDGFGVPAAVTFATLSPIIGRINQNSVGPLPADIGQIPGPILFSGYFLQVDQAVPQGPVTLEIVLEALSSVEDLVCCLYSA